MIEQDVAAIDVRQEAHDDCVQKVDAEHEAMIWTHPGMTTYYRNKSGRVFSAMLWRFVDYWQMTNNQIGATITKRRQKKSCISRPFRSALPTKRGTIE